MVLLVGGAFLLSVPATGLVRRYAIARELLDQPNPRGSHLRPTPRGGGLAIAVVILGGTALAAGLGWIGADVGLAVVGGGALVAAIGWVDDQRSLKPLLRAVVHCLAAAWSLYWLGGLPFLGTGETRLALGLVGSLFGIIGVVWIINLYNFMDGIDGLAAGEAVLVAGIGCTFLLADGRRDLAIIALLTVGASGGFLVWNWAPAKIFMGDVGSGLLGFIFATLAVGSENAGSFPLLGWLLLLGAFVFDATVTLLRRLLAQDRWYEAHRSHAYQRAVQAGWGHREVTSVVLGLTAGLGVLAWVVHHHPGMLGAMLAVGSAGLGAAYCALERRRPMAP